MHLLFNFIVFFFIVTFDNLCVERANDTPTQIHLVHEKFFVFPKFPDLKCMKKDFRLDKKLEKKVNAVAIHPCQMKIEKMLGKGKQQITNNYYRPIEFYIC